MSGGWNIGAIDSKKPLTEMVWKRRSFQYDSRHTSLRGGLSGSFRARRRLEWRAMRNFLTALLLLAASGPALAQEASLEESRAVTSIVECLLEGVPEQWQRVKMIVALPEPRAETGKVEYLVSTTPEGEDFEAFQPCDLRRPPRTLLDFRNTQETAKQGWIGALLLLQRDGRFALNYDFPK